MKKLIKKYWGVALVVVLLSTLFVGAAPVATAATLAWSVQPTPDNTGVTNQVVSATYAGLDVTNLTVAPDGSLFAVDSFWGDRVWHSADGIVWTTSTNITDAAGLSAVVVSLAVSPSYATDHTVFVLANQHTNIAPAQVYISTNSGISFAVLGGALPAGKLGQSIAVSPTYNAGSGEVMVGTSAAAAAGQVYIWGRSGVLNWTATATTISGDFTKVAYSPNFAIDATRLAISSNNTNHGTTLNTLIASDADWGLTLGPATIDATIGGTANVTALPPLGYAVVSTTIAFPSDFNASSPFSRTCYVGTVSNKATDNVYRITVGLGAAVALGPLTNLGGTDHQAASLAYSGTSAAGSLFFGATGFFAVPWVLSTSTPTGSAAAVSVSWAGSWAAPTGAANASVALATDYATSHKVFVGTTGAESAVSISTDGGFYFYQSGLIDTVLAGLNNFQAANATTFYLVTSSGATISVWKTTDAGLSWYRYLTVASALTGILRVSPSYATDSTVVLGIVGAVAPSNVYLTNNAGVSWVAKSAPVTVRDIAVKDAFTYYIANGAASTVQATANGGWTWQPVATTVSAGGTAITSIKYNVASNALLCANNAGGIYLSTNGNTTWALQGAVGVGASTVAFDANYATNGFMYAIDAAGLAAWDVYRYGPGYNFVWLALGTIRANGDIMSTPDGSLYVSNNATGINRSINPTAGFPTLPLAVWNNAIAAAGQAATASLSYAAGSNTIYAISAGFVWTYGDTLAPSTATSIPTPVAPADGAVFPAPTVVVFAWNAVAGAPSYELMYDTRADFATAVLAAAVPAPLTSQAIAGILAGTTYYWMIHVLTPVSGPWSAPISFQTQLAPVAPNAPPVVAGAVGTTGPGGSAVGLTPSFNWGTVPGATAYEFQLATDASFANILVDATGANALPVVTAYKLASPLKYSTTYFWKVRAISATSQTAWTGVMAFTTLDMPAVAAPPVIITQAPAPVINIPAAPPATQIVIPAQPPAKEISPTYIWAIIIIGAVLVLAVIVLIVRTRRTV